MLDRNAHSWLFCFSGQEGEGISSPQPDANGRQCTKLGTGFDWNQTVCQHQFTERFTVAEIRQRHSFSRRVVVHSDIVLLYGPSSWMWAITRILSFQDNTLLYFRRVLFFEYSHAWQGHSLGTSVLPSILTERLYISSSTGIPARSHDIPSRLRSLAVNSTPPCLAARRFKRTALASVTYRMESPIRLTWSGMLS